MDCVIEGLYIGDLFASRNIRALEENGITTVISLINDAPFPEMFEYFSYKIDDDALADISGICEECSDVIDARLSGGKKVFVNCQAGISRSGSVVMAYLIIKRGMCYADALRCVTSVRSIVLPNRGFEMQLKCIDIKYNGFANTPKEFYSTKTIEVGGNKYVLAGGQMLFNPDECIGFQRIVVFTSFNPQMISQILTRIGYSDTQIITTHFQEFSTIQDQLKTQQSDLNSKYQGETVLVLFMMPRFIYQYFI